MNTKAAGLLLMSWLLTPAVALAQTPPQSTSASAGRTQMYEDIEILRRLLNDKLRNQFQPLRTWKVAWTNQCTICHAVPWTELKTNLNTFQPATTPYLLNEVYDHSGRNPSYPNQFLNDWLITPQNNLYWSQNLAQPRRFNNHPWDLGTTFYFDHGDLTWQNVVGHLLDTQGVYIKGQGVVYTLTLPPPQRALQEKEKPASKPISDWDRIRDEIHQQKQPAEEKKEPPREPTLPELILGVLAENGRHFAQLGDNESITIAITFRNAVGPSSSVPMKQTGENTNQNVPRSAATDSTSSTASGANGDATTTSSVRDYELLGDLELKQSKYAEALAAYYKALNQKLDTKQQAALKAKLAQVMMAQGKYAEAERLLQDVLQLQKVQAEPKPSQPKQADPPRSLLPSKLIISAPRKLLAQYADGKMSLDEFRKQATVEMLNFPPEK
jgi:hypothetical protein